MLAASGGGGQMAAALCAWRPGGDGAAAHASVMRR